jgi:hypothetical protein
MKTKFLLVILVVGFVSLSAFARVGNGEILGVWKYKISEVPPKYESGIMQFEMKDDKVVGFVGNGGEYKTEVKNLVTTDDTVSFKIAYEGGEITVNLKKDGEKLTGTLKTIDGEFPMQAEKVVKK